VNQYHVHPALSAFVILLAIVACVLPGQAVQPAPATNPINIETAVAGTAQAAAQLTEQANPIPATATVGPTDTPTATPKISSSGTSLLTLADGSMQFIDHLAGVQIVFPSGLLVFRVGEPEYYAAWEKQEMQDPEHIDIFAAVLNLDPKNFRVMALDVRPEHMPNGMMTGISVIFLPGQMTSLEEWEKQRRDRHNPCAGYKFMSSGFPQTTNGTQVLVVEMSCGAEGGGTIYERAVYFSLPSGTLHVDLETDFAYKDAALIEFDQVVNSVTALNP
jgi:hypothetical protein